ncbi:MAG TPA: cadmium-translocating P-type ATPase [Hellea balneolensis]|uniref:Cadmium-translocating P-type ATPase n=1 Tax=Hellea balneolensis TaxID=287478 RepID=A0A7V5NWR6_9PROT|nr:cadmium-translocating P-type ATPase [Hellea balneolensis]
MAKIERGISEMPKVKLARMNLSTMRLNVQWDGPPEMAADIVKKLEALGYGAKPFNMELEPLEQKKELRGLLSALAVAGFATMNVMLLSIGIWDGREMSPLMQQVLHWLSAIIAVPAALYAGQPFFRSALSALKNGHANMDVPISLAVFLALALSLWQTVEGVGHTYFDAAVMLLFLLLIGRYLDHRLRLKTGESAQRLAAMQATNATLVQEDGTLTTVPATMIKAGDTLLIAAGERVPVDAEVIQGRSQVDTSIATGETLPAQAAPGEKLYSGMINLTAPLTVKALAVSSDSFLSEISRLVEAGEQKKGRFVRIADKAARLYVPLVHSLAALTFIGWMLIGGGVSTAAINAISVLIITCPCALGLAVPAVQIVASGRLFKQGVLIKSGDALERLAKVDTIVFDKTGTLTLGSLKLINRDEIPQDMLELAARLTRGSRHPVARAITLAAGRGAVADSVKEIPGEGLEAVIDGEAVKFGKASFVGLDGEKDAQTESWLKVGDKPPVRFVFKDEPRMDAVETVRQLKAQNYRIELLTGDREHVARETAELLGIDHWQAGISPKQKLERLDELAREGHKTLMIGDGINDAPALAAAYASASPAGAADVSRAAADIILQGDRLSGLVTALSTAKTAQKRVIENFSMAVIYNMFAVPLAVFGLVNPLIAAVAMSGSSLLVTLNALRLRRG